MVVMDSDHMSLLERGGEECKRIQARLRGMPLNDVATTIVSYEEQLRGWLSRIAKAPTVARQIADYSELKRMLQVYCKTAVLDFDEKAATKLEHLRKAKISGGTMDLKIAAIALANDATLLTRNLSHFGKIPGLRTEDWSF